MRSKVKVRAAGVCFQLSPGGQMLTGPVGDYGRVKMISIPGSYKLSRIKKRSS